MTILSGEGNALLIDDLGYGHIIPTWIANRKGP